MADDDHFNAHAAKHGRRYFSRERALILIGTVLCRDKNICSQHDLQFYFRDIGKKGGATTQFCVFIESSVS